MYLLNIIVLIIILSTNLITAQDDSDNEAREKMIIYEIQDFSYKFFKRDTLRYKVAAFDSIIINYGKPLEKTRYETIEITCDSVTKDRRFLLSLRMINLISDENFGKVEKIRRTTSPWMNRKSHLWIDSLGNRFTAYADDSLSYALSPGGAFSPYLIFPINETYRYINESWMVSSNDTLCENGVPCGIMNQSSLFRALKPIDTLGYDCVRLNYIKTAIGALNVIMPDNRIRTEATIAGSGAMTISKKYRVPVHYFANIEQKLLIINSENDETPGLHFISVDWTLEQFIPSPERTAPEKKQKKKKK